MTIHFLYNHFRRCLQLQVYLHSPLFILTIFSLKTFILFIISLSFPFPAPPSAPHPPSPVFFSSAVPYCLYLWLYGNSPRSSFKTIASFRSLERGFTASWANIGKNKEFKKEQKHGLYSMTNKSDLCSLTNWISKFSDKFVLIDIVRFSKMNKAYCRCSTPEVIETSFTSCL